MLEKWGKWATRAIPYSLLFHRLRRLTQLLEAGTALPRTWVKGLVLSYRQGDVGWFFRHSLRALHSSLEQLQELMTLGDEASHPGHIDDIRYRRQRQRTKGLHQLLPGASERSFSILIPVYRPMPEFFRIALESALAQTAPRFEVLVGYDGPQPTEVYDTVRKLKEAGGDPEGRLREIHVDREKTGGGISATTNAIALEATGQYLLLMDHDDWIRPELIYRYEQTMLLEPEQKNRVFFCEEFKIDERGYQIPLSQTEKPPVIPFPYLFINLICHCLMIPRSLWEEVGGLRKEFDGAQDYDLCLRLDLAGAVFRKVPVHLYAWRAHQESTARSVGQKSYASDAGVRALKEYVARKRLNWEVTEGMFPTSYRAIPKVKGEPTVHVIIPFRDHFEMTRRAVETALAQKGVRALVTAVDNQSSKPDFGASMAHLPSVEVLRVDEPFNFSRLNNLGANESRFRDEADYLLFMNNDVELDPECALEMIRWAENNDVGLVGCALRYPNGSLQHGGVRLDPFGPAYKTNWIHEGQHAPPHLQGIHQVIRVTDAVTGACGLMRAKLFREIRGFDEVWYPIAFSDTDLCARLRQKGYHCLYTPYATAVHHESVSRGFKYFEDLEGSTWLARRLGRWPATTEV